MAITDKIKMSFLFSLLLGLLVHSRRNVQTPVCSKVVFVFKLLYYLFSRMTGKSCEAHAGRSGGSPGVALVLCGALGEG